MIRSKIGKGLQRYGDTKIDSNILIEKTGAMQITVRAGRYTDAIGEHYDLTTDKVINLNAGTDNFVALIYNPSSRELKVWHTTDNEERLPRGFFLLQVLVGWGWFIIPAGTADITDVPLYCFTWIDNVDIRYKRERDPETFQIVDRLKFYGKGEQTGKEYEFDEMKHFAVRRDEGKGVYFMCPKDGAVTRGRRCKVCGSIDTIKIKESK